MKDTEKLCSKCQMGKESYELDPHSTFCHHIECLKNGTCSKFVPLKEEK